MILPLLWALLAGLALVLSWVTAAPGFAWAGYLMLVALAFAVLTVRLSGRGISAHRELSVDRIAFGGRVGVEVELRNESRLPTLWVVATEALPAGLPMTGPRGWVGPLGGRVVARFNYTVEGARRGYYEIGPTVLRTGDIFGLTHRQRLGGPPSSLTVFPRIVALEHTRFPSRRPTGEVRARHRVVEDPTQVVGVRPYQRDDGLRRIHWRATAHTGRLQSKLFEVSAQADAVMVLDLRRTAYAGPPGEAEEAAELAITTAASVAYHLLDRRQRVGLLALARDPAADSSDSLVGVASGRGRDQLARLLSVLGRVELGAAPPLADVLEKRKESLSWGSSLVVITPELEERDLLKMLSLRGSGFEVNTLLVGRGAAVKQRAALEAMGIRASRVQSEADIRVIDL